ncbi:MAG TPA: hypothetical protein VGU45_11865 [Microvirga sp.]|nr:hypothetical protein [Microvirga sp.]
MRVGLRHIIKTDGTVEALGYDIGPLPNGKLSNFHPGAAQTYQSVVDYHGQRAELSATLGREDYQGHILEVSTHFPRNQLATDLLGAAGMPWLTGPHQSPTAYGDAILVTDNRMHWCLRPWRVQPGEVALFDGMLTTPRSLLQSLGGHDWIFFHEEPNQTDIVSIMVRWV